MSTSSLPGGNLESLTVPQLVLTVVAWIVATLVFLMIATQGIFGSLPFVVPVVIGVLVGLVVAWAISVVLSE